MDAVVEAIEEVKEAADAVIDAGEALKKLVKETARRIKQIIPSCPRPRIPMPPLPKIGEANQLYKTLPLKLVQPLCFNLPSTFPCQVRGTSYSLGFILY